MPQANQSPTHKWYEGLTPQIQADVRKIEASLGVRSIQEGWPMGWQEESDEVIVTEPIVAKKDCKMQIDAVEPTTWKVKETANGGAPGYAGQEFKALKLTATITDENIQTEHEGARPRLTLEHQFNVDKYPYLDRKSGTVRFMGRQNLYDLEEAFGFEPLFTNGEGKPVEAYVTRTGRKVAPKGEGIKRKLNPDFLTAYFTIDGTPNLEWAGKTVYADIDVERSEQYGDKNVIKRFKRVPVAV